MEGLFGKCGNLLREGENRLRENLDITLGHVGFYPTASGEYWSSEKKHG